MTVKWFPTHAPFWTPDNAPVTGSGLFSDYEAHGMPLKTGYPCHFSFGWTSYNLDGHVIPPSGSDIPNVYASGTASATGTLTLYYGSPTVVGGTNAAVVIVSLNGSPAATTYWGDGGSLAWRTVNLSVTVGDTISFEARRSQDIDGALCICVCSAFMLDFKQLTFTTRDAKTDATISGATVNCGTQSGTTDGSGVKQFYVDIGSSYNYSATKTGYWPTGVFSTGIITTNVAYTIYLGRLVDFPVDPGDNFLPVAAFSGTPLSGEQPLSVVFTDASTKNPTTWEWSFGDGDTTTAQNPTHEYGVGSFTVSLTVENFHGVDTETKVYYVNVYGSAGPVELDDDVLVIFNTPGKSVVVPLRPLSVGDDAMLICNTPGKSIIVKRGTPVVGDGVVVICNTNGKSVVVLR